TIVSTSKRSIADLYRHRAAAILVQAGRVVTERVPETLGIKEKEGVFSQDYYEAEREIAD
ncbi:MAG: hypothetical protein J2P41_17295, partial [Blastocatellia bacterium]|nr:hypothetical protein [Blastocatellia bacterium]